MGKKLIRRHRQISGLLNKEVQNENNLRHLWVVVFLTASVFLSYSNSLNGTWALDDAAIGQYASIEDNLNLRLGYRKIAYLSFLFNKWINPFSVLNYRITNIVIHIINSILVYWISMTTLRLPMMKERSGRYAYPVALLTSAVFALHPININAVAYIVQRMTSLSAMFVFLALLSYIYGRTASSMRMSLPLYTASAVFVFLGIFSKENAVMALPLIVLYDYFFIAGGRVEGHVRKAAIVVAAGLVVLAVSSVYLDLSAAAGDLLGLFFNMNQQIPPKGWTAVDVYWTPFQHILTEFRVIGRYLLLLLAPVPGLLVFDRWGLPPSDGITEPVSTLFSFLVITGLLIFSLLKARKMPFISFGLLWYLVAISLESFIAVGSDFYFEHRNYLPVAGLFMGAIAQAIILSKDTAPKGRKLWIAVLIVAVLLGGLTFKRNFIWKDSVTLWGDTVEKGPGNLRAMVALGNAYLKSADLASASQYYEKALELSSSDKRPGYFNDSAYCLGMVNLFMGNMEQAKKVIDLMDRRLEGSYSIGILKGFYNLKNGDHEAALSQLNQILPQAKGLDRVIVYTLLGDTCRSSGDAAGAIENYKKALELDPSFSAAYYGMGDAYFSLKDVNKAEMYIGKTLSLDPSNPLALAQMADIMLVKKEPVDRAKTYADKAVSLSPTFYQPYATMGTVLVVMGKEDEAEVYFKKANERGLRGYRLPFVKARAYFIKGDKEKAGQFLSEAAGMEDAPAGLRNIQK